MVEPDRLARLGVARQGGAHGTGAQTVAILPLDLDPPSPAVPLDLRLVGALEDGLPGEAEAVPEIADVHPAAAREPVPDLRRNPRQDLADVGDRGLAARLGGMAAEE